jgi:hypothetical protein
VSISSQDSRALRGENMGYKKWGKEISFADLAVRKSLEHIAVSR